MNNENWNDSQNNYEVDPWDRETYQTGSTTPPKNHGGMIAVILTLSICLCGILTTMALLKVQPFQGETPDHPDAPPVNIQIHGREETEPSVHPTDSMTEPTENTVATMPSLTTDPIGDPPILEKHGVEIPVNQSPSSPENLTREDALSLQAIYEKNIPSVVSITCAWRGGTSTGTGVILTEDGYIVTNAHVVQYAQAIQVLLTSGETLEAALVGTDEISDLAVLWVDHDELIPAELGESQNLRVGDVVVAIGDPLGISLRGTMTDGIVSGINRDIAVDGRTMTLIQTNAALNEGNSGGPLINCYGQVIGINTMKIGDSMSAAGVEGLGFAIPSETVRDIVTQLIGQGYVSGRPDLGISGKTVSTRQQLFGLPSGMLITEVKEDSDVYAHGVRVDDVILAINGTRIYSTEDFTTMLYASTVGEEMTLIIYRDGRQYEVKVLVGEYGA